MQDKIKTNLISIQENPLLQKTICLVKTFWTVVLIIAPAALSAYLLITTEDKVVLVIGVAAAVFSLINLVSTSYKANLYIAKPVKKRK